jgi:hydroxyethylthiazole kinase-like uncharacterized protein yjeF
MKTLSALHLAGRLVRHPAAHKGDAGKVLLIGGAPTMSGALVLAGQAALYSGAGWIVLLMLDAKSAHVVASQAELMVHDANTYAPQQAIAGIAPDVIAIGPGLGVSEQAAQWLEATLAWQGPLVIDADALNLLSSNDALLSLLKTRKAPSCLTPHPGEAARFLQVTGQDIQSNRAASVARLVEQTNTIVVLKGQHTLVASPTHEAHQCQEGNAGMAVGGMGDVLTGCIAALAAQGIKHQLDLWDATCLGVQLHALAGDALVKKGVGPIGLTPSELARELLPLLRAQINPNLLRN